VSHMEAKVVVNSHQVLHKVVFRPTHGCVDSPSGSPRLCRSMKGPETARAGVTSIAGIGRVRPPHRPLPDPEQSRPDQRGRGLSRHEHSWTLRHPSVGVSVWP